MIISKTPFRVSFFGGGTDYPDWYLKEGGITLSTTIDRYCYVTIRNLPKFFDYNYRLRYFRTEEVNDISEIEHPSIRECAKFLNVSQPFELVHFADMPAQSGLGSSSTFTVGLLHALHALKGKMVSKDQLMKEAIHVEQNVIEENVGSQDQAAAAHGGFNTFEFKCNGEISVKPVILNSNRLKQLSQNLLLVFTGFSRTASDVAKHQIQNISNRYKELEKMCELTNQALDIITDDNRSVEDFGELLNTQWQIKKTMSSHVSNEKINELYDRAIKAGALGGKLLGAGSGGFMLLYTNPDKVDDLKNAFRNFLVFDFKFETDGSTIIHYRNS